MELWLQQQAAAVLAALAHAQELYGTPAAPRPQPAPAASEESGGPR